MHRLIVLALVASLAFLAVGCGPCDTIKATHDGIVVGLVYPNLDARAAADPTFAKDWTPAKATAEEAYALALAGCASGKVDRVVIARAAGLIAGIIERYGSLIGLGAIKIEDARANANYNWREEAAKMRALQAELQ